MEGILYFEVRLKEAIHVDDELLVFQRAVKEVLQVVDLVAPLGQADLSADFPLGVAVDGLLLGLLQVLLEEADVFSDRIVESSDVTLLLAQESLVELPLGAHHVL